MPDRLAARVRLLVADAQAAVKETEDRLAYRKTHGRTLSKAHTDALAELGERLGVLRERLGVLLGPDVAKLYEEFTELQRRLGLEVEEHGE